ncbi:MAG: oligosaccharide flippase family protein [Bacteroidales bacterium]|nr:oligosaccharide flippase family protein [Bacteroidales bacterium]
MKAPSVIRQLFRSEFFRNVSTLMTGTAIAQAIPILISPILSRLYSPDDFAVLALFVSISTIIGIVATGRYEMAVMLPKEKRDALNIIALSGLIAVGVSLLTLLLVWLLHDQVVLFFKEPLIGPWLYMIPVVVLFTGLFRTLNYWSTRNKTFKRNAATRISQSTVASTTQLGLGALGSGSVGLVTGFIAGVLIRPFILGIDIFKNFRNYRSQVSREVIKKNARTYKDFPRINTAHAFLGSLQDNGIVYVIIYFFEKAVLGSYSFAFRVIKAPAELIGSSVYQVFFQKASQAQQSGQNLQPMVKRLYRNLFLTGLPFFVLLFIFSPQLFAFIFGAEWQAAGEIASILTPWIFLNFVAAPVSSLTIIMNKQKEAMGIALVDISLRIISIVIGGAYGDFKLAFILMSILCSLLLIFSLFWFHHIAQNKTNVTY